MVASGDAPISHLIVDAAGFIKRAPLFNIGKIRYTLAEVIEEIRDKSTKEYIRNYPFELICKAPSNESLKIVTEIAKKTGDYASLSATDLKVIALTHDLHLEHIGQDSINYNISVKVEENFEKNSDFPLLEEEIGFFKNKNDTNVQTNINNDNVSIKDSEQDEDDEGDWITQNNLDNVLLKYNAGTLIPPDDEKNEIKVACLTTDFSIQNILMHMKLNIVSLDGLLIKKLKSYVLKCRSCSKITTKMDKEFCSNCGYSSLERVAVSVDDNGVIHLHIDFERLRVTRGFRHSVKMPKGGKHDLVEKEFEDQRIAHNFMSKIKDKTYDISPFMLNDVNSRSACLGIRALAKNNGIIRSRRNPNENKGVKRKKK